MKKQSFGELTETERQCFSEYLIKERHRHEEDISNIDADLSYLETYYGIKPTGKFINVWIDVK